MKGGLEMGVITKGRLTLSPKEVAELLGISEKTLWLRTREGLIPAVKLGRRVLYPVNELEAWLRREIEKKPLRRP
jgi:excisionase family DNA binding protein